MADSKTAWKSKAVHEGITLPSGAVVDIQLPNLPALAKSGQIPNDLLQVATKIATTPEDIPEDILAKMDEYHQYLVSVTVVKPSITLEEVNDLPPEDIDALVAFATRSRIFDAVGHHIAGLETIDSFRRFHNLDGLV